MDINRYRLVHVRKATDVESYSVPSAITTHRANVRTKSNDMETQLIMLVSTSFMKLYTNTSIQAQMKIQLWKDH